VCPPARGVPHAAESRAARSRPRPCWRRDARPVSGRCSSAVARHLPPRADTGPWRERRARCAAAHRGRAPRARLGSPGTPRAPARGDPRRRSPSPPRRRTAGQRPRRLPATRRAPRRDRGHRPACEPIPLPGPRDHCHPQRARPDRSPPATGPAPASCPTAGRARRPRPRATSHTRVDDSSPRLSPPEDSGWIPGRFIGSRVGFLDGLRPRCGIARPHTPGGSQRSISTPIAAAPPPAQTRIPRRNKGFERRTRSRPIAVRPNLRYSVVRARHGSDRGAGPARSPPLATRLPRRAACQTGAGSHGGTHKAHARTRTQLATLATTRLSKPIRRRLRPSARECPAGGRPGATRTL
jgi:hypothetical protein